MKTIFLIGFFSFLCCVLEGTQVKVRNQTNQTIIKTSTGKDGNCDKMIRTTRLIRGPRVTATNRGRPVRCVYRLVKYGRSSDLFHELNFKTFQVGVPHNSSRCMSGYLQIVDDRSRVNASGYFCGKLKYSRTFLTDSEYVALVFYSAAYSRKTYFRVQASVLPRRLAQERHKELVMDNPGEPVPHTYCDRVYVNCRGFCDVTSPNYPGFYPRNATCRYRIVFNDTDDRYGDTGGGPATRTRVVLGGQYYDNFDVWGGPQSRDCHHSDFCSSKQLTSVCPYDQVRIYDVDTGDGDQTSPMLIQTFCGRGHLPRIASVGREILLEFVSTAAGSMSNDGFYLSIGPEVLREQFTGMRMNDSGCLWVFNSSQSVQGQFHNPRHWYPPGTRCSYLFVGEPHERIFLHFTYFNANGRDVDSCRSKLTLYDSDSPHVDSISGVFCGGGRRDQQPNETVLSTSDRFYVEFDSKTGSYDGSNFEYSVLYMFVNFQRQAGSTTQDHGHSEKEGGELKDCDETFTSVAGFANGRRTSSATARQKGSFDFFSNRLRLRHRNVACTLRFRGRHTERIRLVFTRLQFEASKHCDGQQKQACADNSQASSTADSFDRLLVVNGRQQTVECLCSAVRLPHEILSTDSYLELRLRLLDVPAMAYRDTQAYSFRGRYEFLQVGCGENYLSGKQGQLTFPSLPVRLLPSQVHCAWTIEVSHGKHVFVKFARLSMPSSNCSSNSLRLYAPWSKHLDRDLCSWERLRDGRHEVEPLGWTSTMPKTANKVVLELNASSSSSAVTFKLLWTEVGRASDHHNEDGDCEYVCPRSDLHMCISRDLVCNGVINCPTANASSWDPLEESLADCASIGMVWQWVFITFTSSFIVVLAIAGSLFWRKTRCADVP